jgi:dienelactone hydrolase
MAVKWESTHVQGRTMRIYVGVPKRPGPQPGMIIVQHAGGVDAQMQPG